MFNRKYNSKFVYVYEKKFYMMFNIYIVIYKFYWLICFGYIKSWMEFGFILELYEYYFVIVLKIMSGDMKLMDRVIKDYFIGVKEFCCFRSRLVYINVSYYKISVNDYYSVFNNVCFIK